MQELYCQTPLQRQKEQLYAEQRVTIIQTRVKNRVKELRGYSDSMIVDKLMDYSEGELQELIDYAGSLMFTIGASKLCRLAKEARRRKNEKARQEREEKELREREEKERHEREEKEHEEHQIEEAEIKRKENEKQQLQLLLQSYQETGQMINKSLAASVNSITAIKVKKCTIEEISHIIPQELCLQLVGMMPWEPIPPSFPIINDDDILRYYIKKASKSFVGWDMLIFVVKKALKKILGTPILPIPDVTTVYLFVNWSEMLSLLTNKHYGDKTLSKDNIVAISLSLVAMLLQLLNRESPLSYLKTVYSGGVYAKDFVAKMPSDLKQLLVNVFFKDANEQTKGKIEDILSYNIITWNNVLGELTEINNLSMGKTIDMLYTFRVGTIFLDYANEGKGMQIHSLSEYWNNYGPLPNNPAQMERLFSLFRNNPNRFKDRYHNTINKYRTIVAETSTYEDFLIVCKDLYAELSFLSIAYQPESYKVNALYTFTPECNLKIIVEIVQWATEVCAPSKVYSYSTDRKSKDLFLTIQRYKLR